MVCPKCGTELRGKSGVCGNCGARIPAKHQSDRPDPIFDSDYDWLRASQNTETAPAAALAEDDTDIPEKAGKRGINKSTVLLLAMAAAVLLTLALLLMLYMRWGINAELHGDSGTPRPVYGDLDIDLPEETAGISFEPVATSVPVGSSETIGQDTPTAEPTPTPAPTPAPTPTPTPAPTPLPSDSEYILSDSDKRYLSREDLAGLTQEQCCLARNEIYARHGRIFMTAAISRYFSSKSWYSPTVSAENFRDSVLNSYEIANIEFISDYENEKWGGSYY